MPEYVIFNEFINFSNILFINSKSTLFLVNLLISIIHYSLMLKVLYF